MPDKQSQTNQKVAQLFKDYADYLYNFAISRVSDVHVAEDLVQETFISALKNYDSFEGKSKESTWLTAILKNKIIDHYRKKVKQYLHDSIDRLSASDDFFDDKGSWYKDQRPSKWDFDTDKSIEQQEFYTTLQECLTRLNEIQRIAFVMKHMDDVNTDEICKELNVTASNYWVIMHRAKLQLRKCMETNWTKI